MLNMSSNPETRGNGVGEKSMRQCLFAFLKNHEVTKKEKCIFCCNLFNLDANAHLTFFINL